MNITDGAVSAIERTGISLTLIVLVAAAFLIYFQFQQLKLTELNIRKAQRDLGEQEDTDLFKRLFKV